MVVSCAAVPGAATVATAVPSSGLATGTTPAARRTTTRATSRAGVAHVRCTTPASAVADRPPRVAGTATSANVAVAERAARRVVTHRRLPVQAPRQPVNALPRRARGVSVTRLPRGTRVPQRGGQAMRPEAPVTEPEPVPATRTVSGTSPAKVAKTVVSPPATKEQARALPAHGPAQPASAALRAGAAVRTMRLPAATRIGHVARQARGSAAALTVPGPATRTITVTSPAAAARAAPAPATSASRAREASARTSRTSHRPVAVIADEP